MSRTWWLRGVVAATFAVLAGAWALSLAGLGGAASPADEPGPATPSDSATVADEDPPAVEQKPGQRPARDRTPSAEPVAEDSPDATEEIVDEAPDPAATRDSRPTPRPPAKSPKPSKSPTPTPSQPGGDCTDLVAVVDCVLAPITTRP